MKLNRCLALASACALFLQSVVPATQAWDYEAHRVITQLALASLPTNFPGFVNTPDAAERLAFLAGEPDRWRNVQDLALRHANGPDHYLDLEELATYGLKPDQLAEFRYDFAGQLALFRSAHPDKFRSAEAGRNEDRTRELVGFLPWAITENFAKAKSGFSCLRTFQEEGGTAEEIANAKANVIYVMGVLSHFVGDAAQPLHTTVHHHGWVGANPNNYSTNSRIHSWIDGGYLQKVGGANLRELKSRLRPAQPITFLGRPARAKEIFPAGVAFIEEQHQQLERLYQMDKDGRLSGNGEKGLEGKAFLEGQLLKAAQQLGDYWLTAWQQAPEDTFLKGQLARRKNGGKTSEKP
jgi:hypothetical protein